MARRPNQRTLDRIVGWTLSIGAHLALLIAILLARTPPKPAEPEPITVSLFEGPPRDNPAPPDPPGPPAAAAEPTPPIPPPPPKLALRPAPPSPTVRPVLVDDAPEPVEAPPAPPSDAQLAGARTAGADGGGGGGGRECDMIRRLQAKLREDALVQAAVATAHRRAGGAPKAIWLWNGDWVRNPGEEGKGLAVVRQAVIWEVGFAPEACREEPMHGLVLISLNDAPGSVRLAIGSGSWRWPDLLFPRRGIN